MYQIIDNFLDEKFYLELNEIIKSENIPWYFKAEDTQNSDNKNGYFCHNLYINDQPDSAYYISLMKPILKKLNYISCVEARINLTTRDIDTVESGFHVDQPFKNATTGILYLTDSNARTVLKIKGKEIFVKSKNNRLLLFDTEIQHKVIYHSDIHKRYVINFTYIGDKNYGNREITNT